jgi:hypothetical protein
MDTGATNHLTSEMAKLNTHEPYQGHDHVRTANGAGMHISHVGQASLLTSNSRHLRLLNVLHVPSVTRSLLSVPQLTRDNDVFVEFHRFHFLLRTGPRGTFFLEVDAAMVSMSLLRQSPRCSAVFVFLHHIGTLVWVILPLLLFAMSSTAMSFQLGLVIK